MEQIHKKTTNGIGHNSDILKDRSPTKEAIEDQLFEVGKHINNITNKLWRIAEQFNGAHGDEIVVNQYERDYDRDDYSDSQRVVRKASKYERGELHFEAKNALSDVKSRLTHLHLNIDSYINGDVKEITDKQKPTAKKSEGGDVTT